MSDIWKKAPAKATHYTHPLDDSGMWSAVFWRLINGFPVEAWRVEDSGELTHVSGPSCTEESKARMIARPWPGGSEIYPPAGTVCELRTFAGGWGEAEIKYQGRAICVWLWVRRDGNSDQIEFAECPDKLRFRPIRTPEQIAAEEREAFARTLTFEMGKDPSGAPNAMNQAFRMYDLGYRKVAS